MFQQRRFLTKLQVKEKEQLILTPERKLLIAILDRAVMDLHDPEPKYRRSARAWFRSSRTDQWSFAWIYEQLGLTRLIIDRVDQRIEETEAIFS